MNKPSPVEFFLATTAAEVRTMPVSEARAYLSGLLALLPTDLLIVEPLRAIYRHIDLADDQLDLIATGQLKLNLPEGMDGNRQPANGQ